MGGTSTSRETGVPKGTRQRFPGPTGAPAGGTSPKDTSRECPDQISMTLESSTDSGAEIGAAGVVQSADNASALAIVQGNKQVATVVGADAERVLRCIERGERYAAEITRKEDAGLTVRLVVVLRKL